MWKILSTADDCYELTMSIYDAVQATAPEDPIYGSSFGCPGRGQSSGWNRSSIPLLSHLPMWRVTRRPRCRLGFVFRCCNSHYQSTLQLRSMFRCLVQLLVGGHALPRTELQYVDTTVTGVIDDLSDFPRLLRTVAQSPDSKAS